MVSLGQPGPGSRLSLDEWAELSQDVRGELVGGRLEEEEMPDYVHELIVAYLCALFRAWIRPRGGFVGASDAKFAVAPQKGRKPDVSVYLPGRRPAARGVIRQPPDIMVEVVSPTPRDGLRDRVTKLDEYAAFGVVHYWVLDPSLRSLEIFELGSDGRYTHALGAASGTLEALPGCPGLVLDLDALWREVDELDRDQ